MGREEEDGRFSVSESSLEPSVDFVQAKPPRLIRIIVETQVGDTIHGHNHRTSATATRRRKLGNRPQVSHKLNSNPTALSSMEQDGYDSLCRNLRYAPSSSSESIDDHSIFEVLG